MDEFICVTEYELKSEYDIGTTILDIQEIDMIGESKTLDLSDIELSSIRKYNDYPNESKKVVFLREKIHDMNFGFGCHFCNPCGIIQYSSKQYYNKHMSNLGLPYLVNKWQKRYERCEYMRQHGLNNHYINDIERITNTYRAYLNTASILQST